MHMSVSVDEAGKYFGKKTSRKGLSHPFTSAFLIYMSVYLSAHSNRAQQLIKYCHTVGTAASRHTGWGGGLINIMYNSD